MKKLSLLTFLVCILLQGKAQTVLSGDYKIVNIGNNGNQDLTRSLILLHEMFNGTVLGRNYAIGTIQAMRGTTDAYSRLNVVSINTSSAYNSTTGMLTSYDDSNVAWALKTCIFEGKKYLAVDVPYSPGFHQWGYWFEGATRSTGENLRVVNYETNGNPVNQGVLSNIENYTPNMLESHSVASMSVTGNLGVGTFDTKVTDLL